MKTPPRILSSFAALLLGFGAPTLHATTYTVFDDGFEGLALGSLISTSQGGVISVSNWTGDDITVVEADHEGNGIAPLEGVQMLNFNATSHSTQSLQGKNSDLWRLVDLNAYASQIDTDSYYANLSAGFNRVAGDSQTDTEFQITVFEYASQPSTISGGITGYTRSTLHSDADTSTWETGAVAHKLQAGTRYVALSLKASENVFQDNLWDQQFDGHYVDDVKLELSTTAIPEPTALACALLALGMLSCSARGRRRR